MAELQHTISTAIASPKPSIVLPRTGADVEVRNVARYRYLQALLGADELAALVGPWTVHLACDGVYNTTPLCRRELIILAEAVARADGVLARLGRGHFRRMVRKIKQELSE